jgi:hypothetical protein
MVSPFFDINQPLNDDKTLLFGRVPSRGVAGRQSPAISG